MPRKLRHIEAGLAYHVTQRGANGQPVFRSDTDRLTYLSLLARNNHDGGVGVLAWCLMPSHIHLAVVPHHAASVAALLRVVNGRYSQYFNIRHNRSGPLWHGRYTCAGLESGQIATAIRYVERSPVRAQLAAEPQDYRWSSAAAHLSGPKAEVIPLLDWDYWTDLGGATAWSDLLRQPESISDVMTMRFAAASGAR